MRFAVARGVKHDLIVLPEALEEGQGLALANTALPGLLENLAQSSLSVDRAEQAIAGRVDGESEIWKWVGAVDQDGDATPRDALPDANGPRHADRDVLLPAIARPRNRLTGTHP